MREKKITKRVREEEGPRRPRPGSFGFRSRYPLYGTVRTTIRDGGRLFPGFRPVRDRENSVRSGSSNLNVQLT